MLVGHDYIIDLNKPFPFPACKSHLVNRSNLSTKSSLNGTTGMTPLMVACAFLAVDVVKALLERPEVNLDALDDDLSTALHHVLHNSHTQALKVTEIAGSCFDR